jgi:isoleucyl-tRNA synthetase
MTLLNDASSAAVYWAFEAAEDLGRLSQALQGREATFAVRAPNAWAPPANAALTVDPDQDYVFYDLGPKVVCVAKDWFPRFLVECRADHLAIREVKLPGQEQRVETMSMAVPARLLAYASGADLVGLKHRHPLHGSVSAILADEPAASAALKVGDPESSGFGVKEIR